MQCICTQFALEGTNLGMHLPLGPGAEAFSSTDVVSIVGEYQKE